MARSTVMLIRHGEKSDAADATVGVDISGRADQRELSVRGWQRAGAIAVLFGHASDGAGRNPALSVPTSIYAARPTSRSVRSLRTVEPLAAVLSLKIDTAFGDGDEAKLAAKVGGGGGAALIAWKHDRLPALAALIGNGRVECPARWPDDRFDVVWVFEGSDTSRAWSFRQIPQLLLPGDRAEPIRL